MSALLKFLRFRRFQSLISRLFYFVYTKFRLPAVNGNVRLYYQREFSLEHVTRASRVGGPTSEYCNIFSAYLSGNSKFVITAVCQAQYLDSQICSLRRNVKCTFGNKLNFSKQGRRSYYYFDFNVSLVIKRDHWDYMLQ